MSEALTKAQRMMLEAANERNGQGGVLGFGPHRQVQDWLRLHGLLTIERGEDGYYHITDAGRAALTTKENSNAE
jgi:hypothetical protein